MVWSYNRIAKIMYGRNFVSELYSYTNTGASTGGSIATGLNRVIFVKIQEQSTAAEANLAALNTTLPTGDTFTIVTTAAQCGYCWVIGSS